MADPGGDQLSIPLGWVDLHVHILPGMDDGAADVDQALEMARLAQGDGIECLVATPHVPGLAAHDARPAIQRAARELEALIQKAGLLPLVLPGAEVAIDLEIVEQARAGRTVTLAGGRYLLLELPMAAYPLYTEEVIFQLQLSGLSVILAHPERNPRVQEHPERLIPLVQRGVLLQLTAASILGEFGPAARRTSEYFLRGNMAHVIASDAHGGRYRRPVLSAAVATASEIVGPTRAEEMVCGVPQAIIRDETFEPERPAATEAGRSFWRRLSWK